jgi:AcrR family transcriptional regulator
VSLKNQVPPYAPLPRGRHKLSAETVRASQRERLLRAMLESVAERGYDATSVPQVVALARVSRNAFYALFEDKLDCFLALCEELSEELLDETFTGLEASTWRDAVREGARRYLWWWQAQPLFSRAYLVELPTAGSRAVAQRARAYELFAERFELLARWARQQEPELAPVRPSAARFIVWAITELVTAEVAAGRGDELGSLEDEIVWLVKRLIAEPAGARPEARRPRS